VSPKLHDALIARVIAAMAYVAAAFEVSTELDDIDPEDREVLLDQVDCAGRHIADVIWFLHPVWREMSREDAEDHALEVFREHRPDIDEHARGLRVALDHLEAARAEVFEAARLIDRRRAQVRYRNVARELDFTADHLDNALYLLDPESWTAMIDAVTPAQRVQLASRLEVIELELEETRQIVRSRAMN
jgi:hypothetical protein